MSPVVVSPALLEKHARDSPLLSRAIQVLEEDEEVQELLRLSNVFAVHRLKYNDHGPTHAKIAAGAALELFSLLLDANIMPSCIKDDTCNDVEEAKLIVLLGAYFHDIGNSVHREKHEYTGALMAKDILDRILPKILPEKGRYSKRMHYNIRQEVMHAIYCTETDVECLTVEAGCVKVGDGLDMAEGRARVPYKLGKVDIHAVSALSIKRVEIGKGVERPIRVTVHMEEWAGIFQVEKVLLPKILRSGICNYIELVAISRGKEVLTFPPCT
ncbi:MAG: HD domain-containing protein [Crenarchaeota archaeon]|nr:HD domain-containing protein [Thermoproteota archaeon]